MRCILFAVLSLLSAAGSFAQVKPNSTPVYPTPSVTVQSTPGSYTTGMPVNYVRTWTASRPFTDPADLTATGRTLAEVKQTTAYFDGLGRPLQSVSKGATPTGKDLVSMHTYDVFGREAMQYLPYVSTENTGTFKADPFTAQATFAATQYPGEQVFYGQTVFEPSPLSRPLKTLAPGNSWAGSDRGVAIDYQFNDANEVRVWDIGFGTNMVAFSNGSYNAGELDRKVTTDEHGKRIVEYKDKEGRVVLKKVEIATTAANIAQHTGWLCTYYVYDDLGNLRTVIPPKATEWLAANNWNLGTTAGGQVLSKLCFRYEYDERNRMVVKQVPGAGEVWMVYDSRDRLVMTQDAKMRPNELWIWTYYDALNRPIKTVLGDYPYERTDMVDFLALDPDFFAHNQLNDPKVLTETYYDNYSWTSGTGMPATFSSSETSTGFAAASDIVAPFARSMAAYDFVQGMATGSKVRVLGTNIFLYTVTFYDDRGRVIQTHSTNLTGGTDITTTQYAFDGRVLAVKHNHNATGLQPAQTTVITYNDYDDAGRLVKVRKSINGGIIKTILQNEYDELGQLKTKKLSSKGTTTDPLATIDHQYNIRGWLTGINKDYANGIAPHTDRYFGMQLSYDDNTFTQNQYNGNIAGIKWRSQGSQEKRAYGFGYDAANRLMNADFTQSSASGWDQSAGINYNVKMGDGTTPATAYDANGNILRMQQWGLKVGGSAQIDDLTYSYISNSNQLQQVTDATNDQNSVLGDFKYNPATKTATDYAYDPSGNLVQDNNKAIGNIGYNHLNLPENITVTAKGTVQYVYDAAGNKLKKITTDNTISPAKTTTTWYLGSFVYEQVNTDPVKLQFFSHEEGRVRELRDANNTLTGYAFDYFLKDHLGNIRSMITDEVKAPDVYHASLETANQGFEATLFSGLDGLVPKPICFDGESQNQKVQLLSVGRRTAQGLSAVVGMGKVMKVMAGDVVNANVKGWYDASATGNNPQNLPPIATVLANLFTSGVASLGTEAGITAGSTSVFSSGIQSFLNSQTNYSNTESAYLNWILLDEEQFKLVASGSGSASLMQATDGTCDNAGVLQVAGGINVEKNGYLYVYVSNTSTTYPVYFDQLHIEHTRGALVEENHYYPFGLSMAGISANSARSASPDCGCPANKKGFNGNEIQHKEFSDASGLEVYDFNARTYDQQTGRFLQIDPLVYANEFLQEKEIVNGGAFNGNNLQVYAFAYNNPIRYNDPDGKCPNCVTAAIGAGIGALIGGGIELGKQLWRDGKVTSWKAVGGGVAQGAITGAAAGFTGGASYLTTAAVSGGANVVGGTINRTIQGQQTTLKDVATDATVGAIFGATGKYLGDKLAASLNKWSKIGSTGAVGENALKELGGESQRFFRTTIGGRYVDQFVDGIAHESKVGMTSLTEGIKVQIAKDVELMATGEIKGAVWHFFKSPKTGLVGATKPLLDELHKYGISYVIH
jgi:RHS repeat-associated protein